MYKKQNKANQQLIISSGFHNIDKNSLFIGFDDIFRIRAAIISDLWTEGVSRVLFKSSLQLYSDTLALSYFYSYQREWAHMSC